jgi:hypothetical protein
MVLSRVYGDDSGVTEVDLNLNFSHNFFEVIPSYWSIFPLFIIISTRASQSEMEK